MQLSRNGKNLNRDEIYDFVHEYKNHISTYKSSRYVEIIKLIPHNQYGLDYGCGWGAFTKMIAEKGNAVIGQDLSKNEIDICKHCWNQDDLIFTNKCITEFDKSKFDFVVSNQVIEHTHNPGNYLQEINRVIKNDGTLIISLPNIMNPRFFVPMISKSLEKTLLDVSEEININYDKAGVHIQGWDPLHFVRLVSSVGFKLEKYIPLEGVPMPGIFQKLKIPSYIYPKGRLKNLSYTMVFRFRKIRDSDIKDND